MSQINREKHLIKTIKKNEVISIFEKTADGKTGMCLGFICRRSVVFGIAQGINDGWTASTSLSPAAWSHQNFKVRNEAIAWLRSQKS